MTHAIPESLALAQILVVAPGALDRSTLRRLIEATGVPALITELADDGDLAPDAGDHAYDCIVLTTVGAVARLRAAGVTTPILCLADDPEAGRASIGLGAAELVSTGDRSPTRLAARLAWAVRLGRAERQDQIARAAAARAARAHQALLAIVSHDLRGPLSAINVALDGLADDTLVGADRQRYVAVVQRAVARADQLIRDLLTTDQIETGTLRVAPEAVAVTSLLDQAVRDHAAAATEAGMTITRLVDPDLGAPAAGGTAPGTLLADRALLQQALAKLVSNALRHARGAGAIELTARAGDRAIELSVRDHGPGIPDDARAHIFDRFAPGRARGGGAGLGLAIVRGIVEAHGGAVSVAPTEGGGATFTLAVPRPAAQR